MYVSSRGNLILVFLHLYWNFFCQIRTWNLMPLKFPLNVRIWVPISSLLVRIQVCSLCKDKQTNREVSGQLLLFILIHCMLGIREMLQRHCLDVKRLSLNSGRPYCRVLQIKSILLCFLLHSKKQWYEIDKYVDSAICLENRKAVGCLTQRGYLGSRISI